MNFVEPFLLQPRLSKRPVQFVLSCVCLASLVYSAFLTNPCAGSERKLLSKQDEKADLVLVNGRIYTMNEKQPEAEAIAVQGDRIVAIGTDEDIAAWIADETTKIDLQGQTVVPGFIESHGHLLGLGQLLTELDLTKAKSWDEIVKQVELATKKAKPGEWIVGRGWHQSLWDETPTPNIEGYPVHDKLSDVSPNNPVLLTHRSGHMSFANQKAMDEAGVSRGTPNPSGGEILHDATGAPIGVFRETAQGLVSRALSRSRANLAAADLQREFETQLAAAQEECLRHGVTTFQDAGSSPATIEALARQIELGRIDLRLWMMLRTSNPQLRAALPEIKEKYQRFGNHHLTVGGIKQMVDGALGAHGAWLLEPYADLEESSGLNVTSVETIRETAAIAFENELQLCTHAIGDRANREMLDVFEPFYEKAGEDRELRWRIEHAQHIHPADIPRFGELGVIASMQAVHCTSDGPFVPTRLGTQRSLSGAYVWRSLLDQGAIIANGTDAPVEPISPIATFHASVTRKMKNGEAFFAGQSMTREEALRSMTLHAAYAAFEDDVKGSLAVGKLADLVVLSQDIMAVDEDKIPDTEVELTMIGGNVVYARSESPTGSDQ